MIAGAGIFTNLSVRKPLVIDYKLPYPTGTATGVMINSFFTNGAFGSVQNCSCANTASVCNHLSSD